MTFEGDFVALRDPIDADDRALASWLADPDVIGLLPPGGASVIRLGLPERTLRRQVVIARRSDGQALGRAIFRPLGTLSQAAGMQMVIGDQSGWERGIGRDAVATLTRFGFEQLGFRRIELEVRALDERARYTYEGAGFRYEGLRSEGIGAEDDVLIMGLEREV